MKLKPVKNYPGWFWQDCHCCAGISWGGDYPRECPDCKGGGVVAVHRSSKRLALYPGGPFVGSIK